MLAADLLALTQTTLLTGELARAEPKTLRYRLLHVAARLTRGGRRLRLRLDHAWRWTTDLAAAFTRLHTLPQPAHGPRPRSHDRGPENPAPAGRETTRGPNPVTPQTKPTNRCLALLSPHANDRG